MEDPFVPIERGERPEGRADAAAVRSSAGGPGESAGRTVLVIEDDDLVVDCLEAYLSMQGYRVLVGRDAAQGLQIYRAQCPDAVVADLMMPGPSVLEALRSMKQKNAGLGIVIVTGLGVLGDYGKGVRELGPNAVLKKPFGLDELGAAVKKAMAPGA